MNGTKRELRKLTGAFTSSLIVTDVVLYRPVLNYYDRGKRDGSGKGVSWKINKIQLDDSELIVLLPHSEAVFIFFPLQIVQ